MYHNYDKPRYKKSYKFVFFILGFMLFSTILCYLLLVFLVFTLLHPKTITVISPLPKNSCLNAPTPTPTPNFLNFHVQNPTIVSAIYHLESSYGKNDSCRAIGKYNGFGYNPGVCYNTLQEVVTRVDNRITELLKTYNVATVVCGYNLGFSSPHLQDCLNLSSAYPYYKHFLAYE